MTEPSLPVVVCYVAGTGRTGSTLVANLLGQLPGHASVGEVRYVWERGMREDRLCGCGEPFSTCPCWQGVLARAEDGRRGSTDDVVAVQHSMLRLRALPGLWRATPEALPPAQQEHLERLRRLYIAIRSQTGASVIVDSSKLPTYALVLGMVPGIELRILHLVRDPRGVAHSWQRKKELADGAGRRYMLRQGTARSTLLWQVWNRAVERRFAGDPRRYVRLRYEDFVRDPRLALAPVTRMTGGDDADLPVDDDGTIRLGITHTVAGNPNRLERGPVRLVADDAWRREMPMAKRVLVDALAIGANHRYGYARW